MENSDIREAEIQIARALMDLRGDTLKGIEAAIGIKAANLSSWLRGKPQVMSQQRIALLLNMLGVYGMRLRHDITHEWRSNVGVNELESLFSLLGGYPPEDRELFLGPVDAENLFITTRSVALLLREGKKLIAIRIVLEPGLAGDISLEDLPVAQLHETHTPPNQLVATTPADFRKQLKTTIISTRSTLWDKPKYYYESIKLGPPDSLKEVTRKLTEEQKYLLGEALREILSKGLSIEEVCQYLKAYRKHA
ncbi:MAG: hypothetical protein Q8L72_00785 [Moraxellaceae bacterium]|nr:hypothetical protein [Moraxellaceae bacterium]